MHRVRSGLALTAIRDNDVAAASLGVDTGRLKWFVYVLCAFGTGMIGAVIYLNVLSVTPDATFSVQWIAFMKHLRLCQLIGLIVLLALNGCRAAAPSADPQPAATNVPPPTHTAVSRATNTPTATPAPSATPSLTPPPTATPLPPTATPLPPEARFSYPIGRPERVPGDEFYIRHSYVAENTWYNPGYWHTGEDWYATDGATAGALVYAIAAGDVVYVGSNYPGRVVIIRHSSELYSMYGHLDPAVEVVAGQTIERGTILGFVLERGDSVPDHLHFEVRTFLTTNEVNGADPRYGFRCGVNCPPGPGYWPIDAPDHPGAQGWRTPLHVINGRMFSEAAAAPLGEVLVPNPPPAQQLTLRAAPSVDADVLKEIDITPGERFALLEIVAGPADLRGSSAAAYELWYKIAFAGGAGWARAIIPDDFEQGSDGRPATLRFQLLPVP